MKKILFIMAVLLLAFVVTQANVETASANGGPHGGYTATTDACAGCHRAHTAQGARLLTQNTTFALCMSCHSTAGIGADTNVEDGVFLSGRSASTVGEGATLDVDAGYTQGLLLAGGFTNYGGVATTSSHDVSNTVTGAWGNGGTRGAATALAAGEALNCASCHDPHGSTNYRILKTTVNGNAVTVPQVDEGAQSYDTENWPATMSNICAACHGAYHVTTVDSGSDGGLVATGGYAHRVNMPWNGDGAQDPLIGMGANNPETVGYLGFNLPLAGVDLVTCNTCHFSHGSSAVMAVGGPADGGPDGTGTIPGDTTAADSALLRLDNRGVCEVCHQK